MQRLLTGLILIVCAYGQLIAQERIPASYSNFDYDENGNLYFQLDGTRYLADTSAAKYTLTQFFGNPTGTDDGFMMDFGDFEGSITYGLIPYGQAPHPLPIFRFNKELENGKTEINIAKDFKDKYDFVNWKENKTLTVGYRVADEEGMIVFDGEVTINGTGPFTIGPSIYEGPFVNHKSETEVVIWCNTTMPINASVEVDGKTYQSESVTYHEWNISGLTPDTPYDYKVMYATSSQTYEFRTPPEKGSRNPFVFAYTSDSRHATGGGERKIYGANAYIMKKAAALAHYNEAAFVQFSGDMINGYLHQPEEIQLQYTNWKKSIEPFWHYMPFNISMGNHEALGLKFYKENGRWATFIDGFPYETRSSEAAFQEAFVNPINGPKSEDGNKYDPDPKMLDFPSYDENVFYYTYGNMAMVVLNSDYWFAPILRYESSSSGGLHGYIMDNQLDWLKQTIQDLENDDDIDHVFVTQHTPVFPNGGHSQDDMWYNGNNEIRPYIAGKPVDKGIIERRDEYLDILINQSSKVLAVLTGDEHNYNWLKLTPEVPIYPEDYPHKKLEISRPIYQINNGASGAPYYAQEVLPWSEFTQSFSVENALCLFYIDGKEVRMSVRNPDTLNEIDVLSLR